MAEANTPPAAAPTQLEIQVNEADQIPPALEWLRGAIEAVNANDEPHSHHLAEVYRAALPAVKTVPRGWGLAASD